MKYEAQIGWRYLYGGKRDRLMQRLAEIALVGVVVGIVTLLLSSGANPYGVLLLVVSMISVAVFSLLSLFSVFTTLAVLGVVFGVAALTVAFALTTGFQREFRDKVLGVNAHVIVMKAQNTFAEYRDVMKTAREIDPEVLSVQPFIFTEMLATRGKGELSGVAIKGVDPTLVREVLDLEKHMTEGSVSSLGTPACRPDEPEPADKHCLKAPPIIMGKELAHKLKAKVGDTLTVVVPMSTGDFDTWRARMSAPRTHKFEITGIFYSGFDEYDRRLMYTSLADSQGLVGRGDQVMGVELKVKNVDRAEEIARRLERALGGPPYQVQDWYELNHNLFMALMLQKVALVVILTLIIIVAVVNLVSSLILKVTEKTREIAMLKSMGSTSWGVAIVFQVFGLAIGGAGTILGVGIGLATCFVVQHYGFHLDPKVYLIDRLPIDVNPIEVAVVAGITMLISIVATLVPAVIAAGLRPVEGLRYD